MKRLAGLFLTVIAAGVWADITALTPVPQGGSDTNHWCWQRHREKMRIVEAGGSEVVFIGDSITHGWEGAGRAQWNRYFAGEPFKALNLGYSAARTEHLLWNILKGGELDGYKAKAVVLMIGTNNTGHRSVDKEPPADTVLGLRAVIAAIRLKQPQAKLILLPIFPRGATKDDPLRRRNEVVNKEIRKFADGRDVVWCDFNDQFLTPDGFLCAEIMPDRLHPGAYGYEIWAAAVLPYVNAACAGRAMPNRFAPYVDRAVFRAERDEGTTYPATRVAEGHAHRGADWWSNRLQAKRNQIAASGGKIDLVFFGDSITHFWEDRSGEIYGELQKTYSILNLGYGGDRTQHLVWRGQYGELDGYQAKAVMLMIGTNNVHSDTPENVAKGIRRVLDVIAAKQPQAKVLLLPIFPRGATAQDKLRVKNEQVNALIRPFADGKQVIWCDFNAKFLDAQGNLPKSLMPDLLHPNREGYAIWRDAVLPHFKEICGK